MLSLKRGVEIAVFTEGQKKGKKIFLHGKDDFTKKENSEVYVDAKERKKLIPINYFKDKKISYKVEKELKDLVDNDSNLGGVDEKIRQEYIDLQKTIEHKLKTELDFTDKSSKIFPLPQKYSERIYIAAPSGSGKSTFIGEYLKQLRIKYPKRKIYIFSRVATDAPLDRFKNLERVDLFSFVEQKSVVEDFANGILIFDDIDTILDKNLVSYLRKFRDDILEVGRHYNITCISTSHIITNYIATRTLINEAQSVVIFPKGGSFGQIRGFLDRYMGFDKELIEQIRLLPTRWVFIHKEYPQYIISEKGAIIF
jgi:Cdc6-like AAA superfamily ATPase